MSPQRSPRVSVTIALTILAGLLVALGLALLRSPLALSCLAMMELLTSFEARNHPTK